MSSNNAHDGNDAPKIPRNKDTTLIRRGGQKMELPGEPLPYGVRKKFDRNNDDFYKQIDLSEYESEDLSVIIDDGSSEKSNRNRPDRITPLKEADKEDDFIKETLPDEMRHAEDPEKMLFGRYVFPTHEDLLSLEKEDFVKLAIAAEKAGVQYLVIPPLMSKGTDVMEKHIEEYKEICEAIAQETEEELGLIPTIYLGSTSGQSGKKFSQMVQKLPEDRFEFIGGHVQYGMPLYKRKNGINQLLNHSDRKVAFVDVPQKMDQYRKKEDVFGNVSREKAYVMIGGSLVFRKRWVNGGGKSNKEEGEDEEDEEDENLMELLRRDGSFNEYEPENAKSIVDEIPLEEKQEYMRKHKTVPGDVETLYNDFAAQEVFEKLREDLRKSDTDSDLWDGREVLQAAVSTYSNIR